jgi:flagellar biosynthetic protein FlhB
MIIFGLALVLGAADYLWQVYRHRIRNRMSRQDLMDEYRDAEGDPHTRATRRQRGQEIAMNRMLADVPTADVIVVNPTHYAVALKWHRAKRQAPICVAKGVDETAARIRDLAAEHGIPVHRDPPTARAVFATVGIGDQIRPDHYRAVAAALRFAEALRKRKARR